MHATCLLHVGATLRPTSCRSCVRGRTTSRTPLPSSARHRQVERHTMHIPRVCCMHAACSVYMLYICCRDSTAAQACAVKSRRTPTPCATSRRGAHPHAHTRSLACVHMRQVHRAHAEKRPDHQHIAHSCRVHSRSRVCERHNACSMYGVTSACTH